MTFMSSDREEVLKRLYRDLQNKIENTKVGIDKTSACRQEGIILALQALNIKVDGINDNFKENELVEKYLL